MAKDSFEIIQQLENKPDTRDRLLTWYQDKKGIVVLTEKDEEIRKRLESAFSMLCNHRGPMKVARLMVRIHGISEAQAFRDIKAASSLFGEVIPSEQKAQKHILYELAMDTYHLAKKTGNINQMNRAIANLADITGIKRDIPDLPDFSKFKPHDYTVGVPEEVLKMLEKLLNVGAVDVSKIGMNNTEDIDHEDVS